MNTHDYDFCVIGAGSAGYAAAMTARRLGKTVAVAETEAPLAGLCILRGCMPSKTLLRSAEIAHLVETAPDLGIEPQSFSVNMRTVINRKRRIIDGFAAYRRLGITKFPIFQGQPRFTGKNELRVGDDVIRATFFLIATGSLINVPDGIPGLRETGFVTSDDVLEMDALPKSVLILGGGEVACELAQYIGRLGSETTVLQRSATVLSHEDADVGVAVRAGMEADGITVETGVQLLQIQRRGARKLVAAKVSGVERSFEADEIFAALGRRPNLDGLDLDAASVERDGVGLKVNEFLQTTNPAIYAAGDSIGTRELVHVAVYEGQLAAQNACGDRRRVVEYWLQETRAVFTDPQVGIAGLNERQCKERGIEYAVATYPFNDLGKAIATDQTRGFIKMLASPKDGTILGVTCVGPEASDLIHEAIALLYFKATIDDVMQMPHLHPTLAEIITYPAEELCDRLEHRGYALVTP